MGTWAACSSRSFLPRRSGLSAARRRSSGKSLRTTAAATSTAYARLARPSTRCAEFAARHCHPQLAASSHSHHYCPLSLRNQACFQRHPLPFNPNAHSLQFNDGSRQPIAGTFVAAGVSPEGSVWAMNPIPPRCLGNNTYNPCQPIHVCTPCPAHLPECTTCGNYPAPAFDPPCNQPGCSGHAFDAPAPVAVYDRVVVPADLTPGKYVLGWRYDAESTQQVSCGAVFASPFA